MPRLFVGRPEPRGGKSRSDLVLALVILSAAAVPVAVLHGFALGRAGRIEQRADDPRFDPAVAYGEPAGPAVGATAPDVALRRADTGEVVRLAALVGRQPLVLVFGGFG